MIDLNSKEAMEDFLECWNSGDPIKDFYDDVEIGMALAEAITHLLDDMGH